jgi:hypothetical protein
LIKVVRTRTIYTSRGADARELSFCVIPRVLIALPQELEHLYDYLVKVKTSITLPAELLVRLDRVDKNRSAVLERAALAYLSLLDQQARDRRDIAIIERNAQRLNREVQDTLEYQRTP